MTEPGPYDTRDDALYSDLHRATGQRAADGRPLSDEQRQAVRLSHLAAAARDCGVRLGRYDNEIVAWVARGGDGPAQALAGMMLRAHAAGRREAARRMSAAGGGA